MTRQKVLLTDYAWADLEIERRILLDAGLALIVAPRNDEETLANLARETSPNAIMTCWAKVTARVIDAAPHCRIVSRLGIGLDNIDVAHCTSRGILVTNVPDYCLTEVAEHTLALLLALARNVAHFHQATKQGRYQLQSGPTLRRVAGRTLGIVGLGNIGRTVAEKAAALGLRILATTRRAREPIAGVEFCSLPELLTRSDFVSLHAPLTPETKHLIRHETLALMKPGAFLINTGRGGLVDHAALAAALSRDAIAGAALDVQDPEPPPLDHPPYNDPRVIVTPHAAFTSVESLANLRERATRQVVAALQGQTPECVVNG